MLKAQKRLGEFYYKCMHCSVFECSDVEEVITHCESCSHMPRTKSYKQRYMCIMCSYCGYQRAQMRGHLFSHTGLKPYRCEHYLVVYSCLHCNEFQTDDLESLVEHCRSCRSMIRPNEYKYKFVCHMCTFGTYDSRIIKAHIFKHRGEKPLKCSKCPYATSYRRDISYTCTHCNSLFTNDFVTVVSHCKTCKRMPRKNPYRSKFVCNQCDYATYTEALITGHIFQHYGVKPFQCHICTLSFTMKCNLNNHMRKQHNVQTNQKYK
ncbi:hypothetical protein M8J77_025958 [Diaphorina citri]|nr:hypothetical protein M8J77_025958 [Diaphorina citri]